MLCQAPPVPPQSYNLEPQGIQEQPRIIEARPTVQSASRTTTPSNVRTPHDLRADFHRNTAHSTVPPLQDTPAIVSKIDPESAAEEFPYQHDNLNREAIRAPSQESQPLPQSSGQISPRDTPSLESFTQSQEGDDERSEESAPTTQEHLPRASSLYLKGVTSQRQNRPPQTPATTGDNAPILPKGTPSVDSYIGSPKEIQTPRSATSSNKTPTQATFTDAGQPAIPAAFPLTTDGTSIWHHRGAGSSPRSCSQPQSGFSAQTSSNSRRGQEPEVGLRSSQDYEDTTHIAGSGDGLPETSLSTLQNAQNQPAGLDPYSQVPADTNLPLESESYQRKFLDSPTNVQNGRPASVARDSLNPRIKSRDYSWRSQSIDSELARTDFDHPPSPLTPRQPTNYDAPEHRGRSGPIHYGIDHDFDRPSDTERSRSRSPAYPRQLQDRRRSQELRPSLDPNILEHPAFRAVAEGNGMPAQYYSGQLKREENLIPRHQAAEHTLVGNGPIVGRRSGSKSRSRRDSRSSAFFKAFTSPSRSEYPPMPNAADSQASSSPRNSPAVGDRKSRPLSIFRSRSRNMRSGSGERRSKENMAPRDAPPRDSFTEVTHQVGPTAPRRVEEDTFSKGVSSKWNKKLQRASTSAKPEPDSGKKKRLSAIGVSIQSFFAQSIY